MLFHNTRSHLIKMHWDALHSSSHSALYYTVFILQQEEGYTVKYTPLPELVPEGEMHLVALHTV